MADLDGMDDLDAQAEALEGALDGAATMAASFSAELSRVRGAFLQTGRDVATLERGLSRGLRRAIDGAVMDGDSLSVALNTLATSMVNAAYAAAVRPVTNHVGSTLAQGIGGLVSGLLPFGDGASFAQGRVQPFASGGVVSGPVAFPMRGGTGLMGEAGPEAIMPLARGSDGKLGVRGQGGGNVSVVMNVSTPDAESFRRSQGQIAAQLGRAISRGQRNR
ncbi:phage tail tape measure protein [Roseovarius salinarum]|uniref:phage tail tape measure protein n=1 Tax=Roseovarius salinarum TaxID=1981892 RepID=UPI000C326232|nr:phage tail tape measure protein [Roseovarius salinarum]